MAEHRRADAFKLQCWRRLLRVRPFNCEQIKSVNPKGNQPRIFTGKIDAEAEAPIPWPCDAKNWLIGKDPDAGKIEGKRSGRQDKMVRQYQLNGHKFEQTLGDREGQGSLACCSPWGHKVRHNLATEQQQIKWSANTLSISTPFYCFISNPSESALPPIHKTMVIYQN